MATNTQLNTASVPIPVFTATISLSSANIQAMYVTPVLLLAAQGAHTCILIRDVFNEYIFNSSGYSNGDAPQIQYGNVGSDASLSSFVFYLNNIVTGSSSSFYSISGEPTGNIPTTLSVNAGIYISNQSASYTGGNSTLKVTINYSVITTTA